MIKKTSRTHSFRRYTENDFVIIKTEPKIINHKLKTNIKYGNNHEFEIITKKNKNAWRKRAETSLYLSLINVYALS